MTGRAFLDTNVLVYAFDRDEPAKRSRARALLGSVAPDDIVVSAQVLGEFYWVVTHRLRTPVTPAIAAEAVSWIDAFQVVPIDRGLVGRAVGRSASTPLSYWDALIVEAALAARCTRLLTEDLAAGTRYDDLEVVNPFA